MNVRFYLSYDIKCLLNWVFGLQTSRFYHIYMQRCYGCHYITLLNMQTTSGSSMLMHGIISLPEVTSYDTIFYSFFSTMFFHYGLQMDLEKCGFIMKCVIVVDTKRLHHIKNDH